MPAYAYTAKNLHNEIVKDEFYAKDVASFKRMLRERDLVVVKYKELAKSDNSYRLKTNEVGEFARQMSGMLDAGVTIMRALEIMKQRDFKPKLKNVFEHLYTSTQTGCTLSESMAQLGRAFPGLFVHMCAAGEASGQLAHVLGIMANHFDKEHRLNSKVKSAMTYPMILLVVTIMVVLIIFLFIMPEFFELFEEGTLPFLTVMMMGISKFLVNYWYWAIVGALVAAASVGALVRVHSVKLEIDRGKLGLPMAGKLFKIIYTARFARTLSSLYSSGINMLNSLQISSTIVGNAHIEEQFEDVIKQVSNGEMLSKAIEAIDGFDSKLATTILIGEESGRLDSMLKSTADGFDYEAEMATERLVQFIEPIMIVLMAVIVGAIMLSVFLPMLQMYNNIG